MARVRSGYVPSVVWVFTMRGMRSVKSQTVFGVLLFLVLIVVGIGVVVFVLLPQ